MASSLSPPREMLLQVSWAQPCAGLVFGPGVTGTDTRSCRTCGWLPVSLTSSGLAPLSLCPSDSPGEQLAVGLYSFGLHGGPGPGCHLAVTVLAGPASTSSCGAICLLVALGDLTACVSPVSLSGLVPSLCS